SPPFVGGYTTPPTTRCRFAGRGANTRYITGSPSTNQANIVNLKARDWRTSTYPPRISSPPPDNGTSHTSHRTNNLRRASLRASCAILISATSLHHQQDTSMATTSG
ncbi:unnamed protein product, partial [Ectocarpus sp. 12 AP-2014]